MSYLRLSHDPASGGVAACVVASVDVRLIGQRTCDTCGAFDLLIVPIAGIGSGCDRCPYCQGSMVFSVWYDVSHWPIETAYAEFLRDVQALDIPGAFDIEH